MGTSEIGLAVADPFLRAEVDYRLRTARNHFDRHPVRRRRRRLRLPPAGWLSLPGQPGRPVALG